MFKITTLIVALVIINEYLTHGCLITNCPRGGKRNGKLSNMHETQIKPCVNCGPGHTGQCFGPNICCGPFGCLFNTQDTLKCQREGFFHEHEPCIAGASFCRKNTGRCAADGVCCSQDSCHLDKSCMEERLKMENLQQLDFYNFVNGEYANEK